MSHVYLVRKNGRLLRKIPELHQGTISFMGAGKECEHIVPGTTIGLKRTTKARLDGNRSPGQSL